MMVMAFLAPPKHRPYLIAIFGVLLLAGVLLLVLT